MFNNMYVHVHACTNMNQLKQIQNYKLFNFKFFIANNPKIICDSLGKLHKIFVYLRRPNPFNTTNKMLPV